MKSLGIAKVANSRPSADSIQRVSQTSNLFVDNRAQAVAQRQLQANINNTVVKSVMQQRSSVEPAARSVAQLAKRTLKDRSEKLKVGHTKLSAMRRAARTLRIERKRGKWTKKNLLAATIKHRGWNFTVHLQSAGMGGKHPLFGGVSAAHTEQQFRALVNGKNQILKGFINELLAEQNEKTLGKTEELNTRSIFSTNQACNKNPSMPCGCESIHEHDMAMKNGKMLYAVDYTTGGHKGNMTHNAQKNMFESESKKKGETRLRRSNSFDIHIDSNAFRGKEMNNLTLSDLKKAITLDLETNKQLTF
ncbi:hypothetical protein [Spirosoma rhododendri]|uniref:Uncharacterized protein n=1 Tax=Spirosoma rhododendri TaxID=2728024 RepID=A0A7L5DUR0_9BACT|nr:hypothetical protein [Spirosoma rhododendri]QJD80328.1 hypothetical protein HH216_19280 [Spirosoma rhododendri]